MSTADSRVKIKLASALKPFAAHPGALFVQGDTVGEALKNLVQQCPALSPLVFEAEQSLNRNLQIYLHQESIQYLNGLDTALETGDELSLVPLTQLEGME